MSIKHRSSDIQPYTPEGFFRTPLYIPRSRNKLSSRRAHCFAPLFLPPICTYRQGQHNIVASVSPPLTIFDYFITDAADEYKAFPYFELQNTLIL